MSFNDPGTRGGVVTTANGAFKANPSACKTRLGYMESNASAYRDHCQEIVNYIVPFRADITVKQVQGVKKMQFINDSTATLALLLFAAGVSSKMCNPAIPWFSLKTTDEALNNNRDVKIWLDWVTRIIGHVFYKSNFYAMDHEANIDIGAFGTAPIFVGEHPTWGCYYDNLSIGETFIATDIYGQVDTLYRRYDLTARQVMQRWPKTCSDKVKADASSNNPDRTTTIVHAVQPRTDRDPWKHDKLNMPWESSYFEYESVKVLQEGGFRSFPYILNRYFVMAGEVYGRGPGQIALPDVKELQIRKRDTTLAGQLRMAPPVLLPYEGFAGVPIKRTPYGFSFVNITGNMQEKIGTFPAPQDLGWSEESMQQMREQIGRTFFSDLMILATDKQMTLGEFTEVASEKMQRLGPFMGRLESERYNPIFERTFDILWDQGRIPPPPRELVARDGTLKYKVEYTSPLAKAQKMSENRGIMQVTGFLGQTSAVRPEILDIIDWDGTGRDYAENFGFPAKRIVDEKLVVQIRQARQQQLQQEKETAMMMQAAKTMPALAKGAQPGSPMEAINNALQEGAGTRPAQ